ncbi:MULTISPECIES: imidazole glycerol phosphate synthase subunit HisF [unclassified Siphonobacter]|uniref:imidazole glycerol phosphate synthase subunit HisF n=1 Tax=unclassified Siphonobacter TaxID=2635712 RepID=UPI000CC059E2|nr:MULTISPECIES: imidazole glycerol phosphate synthase subunit HisF [unclassified Siphonobacter]MDQ1086736.1 cyclase [Siphonobacter sp. SORGH_AS_1065]MDR6196998.1 cyclase [Siphonobacter sp. SORGH_AS_0500]PKK36240.1 imidazole glycerol phosphate synthase subunit HisF [Siphonobacter sp. SORGH_AS_0500]
MLTKRIIPCLDIKDGRTVKGTNFVNLRDAGDPVELGALYAEQGADELVFLDITATVDNRKTLVDLVRKVAQHVNIPFTVGGGISSVEDVSALLNAGADKISINSSAVRRPELIDELALQFGSQCIIVAIDTREISVPVQTISHQERVTDRFGSERVSSHDEKLIIEHIVHTHGGRKPTELRTIAWAKEAQERGAGEILLTSMDADGTKAGFALDLTATVSGALSIPVIASGGAGNMEHFQQVFTTGKADAGLAASIFHFREIGIPDLKNYLKDQGLPIRI